ncbi:hypothetical protein FHX74_002558 [Friedmanniella endophytica]|uniref:Uncharacterized protein n=1 Tax=Microlunatus kandeliicorticis TaxID=1759536 RepID=A0A7W3ITI2_9ACTN|nr:hypothetical protein [Microlunatus kandeliicorticis]MBA8794930.1 hypothetical protein [Microlunatus kandeliicorticis]
MSVADYRLADTVTRAIQDAVLEGTRRYWLRRADQLEECRPQPGDFVGLASAEEIAATDARLAEAARLCRHRASLAAESWCAP